MRTALLTEPSSDDRITGKIQSAVTPGWWLVVDDLGRKYKAASQDLWRRGERVVMIGGQIIGHAGVKKTAEVFEV